MAGAGSACLCMRPASAHLPAVSCPPCPRRCPLAGTLKCLVHVVKDGDTGSVIASAYGATLDELAKVNPGVSLEGLGLGQELRIPPYDDTCKKGVTVAEALAAATGAAAPAPSKGDKGDKA